MRDQLQQTGAIRVTPEQEESCPAGDYCAVYVLHRGAAQPAAVQARSQVDTPRGSTLISDRSQDFDTLLKNLVAQATRTPDSYGELFRRKGVLASLGQIAGVAQGRGPTSRKTSQICGRCLSSGVATTLQRSHERLIVALHFVDRIWILRGGICRLCWVQKPRNRRQQQHKSVVRRCASVLRR